MSNNFNIANWRKSFLLTENQEASINKNINRDIIKNGTLEQGEENDGGKSDDEIKNRIRKDLNEFYDMFEISYTEEEYDNLVEKYINDIESYDEFINYDTNEMMSEDLLSDFELYATNIDSDKRNED